MDFAALIYHRQAFLDGQWWLPLTAQLVHFNLAHGMSNAMVALVLAALFRPMLVWAQQCALILGSAFAVAVVVVSDTNWRLLRGCFWRAVRVGRGRVPDDDFFRERQLPTPPADRTFCVVPVAGALGGDAVGRGRRYSVGLSGLFTRPLGRACGRTCNG